MKKPHLVIIGAGPAGLSAAIAAAEKGCHVTILEYLSAPGRKLLASGGGRCNLTNTLSPEAMAARFPGNQSRFVLPALKNFTPAQLLELFSTLNVKCHAHDSFHYFPESGRATDLLNALMKKLATLPVNIKYDVKKLQFHTEARQITAVSSESFSPLPCDALLIAAGSPAAPALGGRGSIYMPLEKAGHTIVPAVPALVGVQLAEKWFVPLSGTVLPDAGVYLDKKEQSRGEVLFTHFGFSGPAVLDISGRVCRRMADGGQVKLKMNWLAKFTPEKWKDFMDTLRRDRGSSTVSGALRQFFTKAAIEVILGLSQAENVTFATQNSAERDRLISVLTAMELTVTGSAGWEKAMAASGGVSRNEIERTTMSSRCWQNLFFAGEVIDVDGPCGGYNMQWAFSSGRLAGNSAAKLLCGQGCIEK